jgi:phosphatidylglycerophosphate synthase
MTATKPTGRGSIVSPETRTRVKKLGEPIALFFGRLGLTPNGLTLIGFGITVVAAALAGAQLWLAAGIVVIVGGIFDMFDGTLARATGKVSSVGAFMDSVFDRWGEGITYVGIVVGCVNAGFGLGAGLAAFAMASAFLVSYTRAKSEGLGFTTGTGMAEVGLAPREIRLVILSAGLVLAGLTGGVGPSLSGGSVWIAIALGAIGILATITIIQRIIHVRQQAVASDGN